MTLQQHHDDRGTTRPGIRRIAGRSVGYFPVSNEFARDRDLSPRATRVGLYALSHREGWVMTQESIATALDMSVTTVRGALGDLGDLGYLRSWTVRDRSGHVKGTGYLMHDERLDDEQWSVELAEVGVSLTSESAISPSPAETSESLTSDSVHRDSVHRDSEGHKGTNSSKKTNTPRGNPSPAPLRDADASAEALFEVEQPEPAPSEPVDEYAAEPGFGEFWTAYPSSKGKRAALMAYRRARRRGASPAQILAGAQRYAAERSGADPAYTAHGATWLNGARYDDVPDDRPQQRRGGTLGPADPAPASAFAPVSPADDPENAPFDPNDMPEHIASRMRRGADLTGWTLDRYVRSELDMRAALRAEDDETFDRIMRARADAREAAGTTTRGFVSR